MIANFSAVERNQKDYAFRKATLSTEVDGFTEFDYVLVTEEGNTYSLWINMDDYRSGEEPDYVLHIDIIIRQTTVPKGKT